MSHAPFGRIAGYVAASTHRGFVRRAIVLCVLASMLPLAGCPSRGRPPGDAATLAQPPAPLTWSVERAQLTHHLGTSSLESRDAMPGHQFVVLDVSVRNRDAQPQVVSEGKLIALDETRLQTFDQPETLLSDDYLSLQVLAPAQDLHGKIAYEVPEPLSGVLYWSPGNGSERILLNVAEPPTVPSTLADAARDPAILSTDGAATVATADARPQRPAPETKTASRPSPAASVASKRATIASASAANTPVLPPTPVPTPSQAATPIVMPPPAPMAAPVSTRPVVAATLSPGERDLARRQACDALVERNDPADKAGNLSFFADSCRDYALPARWQPPPARHGLLARASALLARAVVAPRVVRISDCSATASRADRLVCADPDLSAMDHQLAQTVARARDQVDDPVALQREQEQWRGRVRNACGTAACLEQAYGRRIAQLDALAPMRP